MIIFSRHCRHQSYCAPGIHINRKEGTALRRGIPAPSPISSVLPFPTTAQSPPLLRYTQHPQAWAQYTSSRERLPHRLPSVHWGARILTAAIRFFSVLAFYMFSSSSSRCLVLPAGGKGSPSIRPKGQTACLDADSQELFRLWCESLRERTKAGRRAAFHCLVW